MAIDNYEECVRAINDRGITILLVPDMPPRAAELERQTRSSALQRLKFGLVYRPGELVVENDIQVTKVAYVVVTNFEYSHIN